MKIRILQKKSFRQAGGLWKKRTLRATQAEKPCISKDVHENPEVSARLTNLSLRHVGSRPAWFDFDPVRLPGSSKQCNRLFWQIVNHNKQHKKQIILLQAGKGMGKTTFLSQLYAMLEHAPETVLTLAPGASRNQPYHVLRNILEQRFYISGETNFDHIQSFVRSAVKSIVTGPDTEDVTRNLLNLWRLDQNGHLPAPTAAEQPPLPLKTGDLLKKCRTGKEIAPPPLATQIKSMDAVLEAHRQKIAEAEKRLEPQTEPPHQVEKTLVHATPAPMPDDDDKKDGELGLDKPQADSSADPKQTPGHVKTLESKPVDSSGEIQAISVEIELDVLAEETAGGENDSMDEASVPMPPKVPNPQEISAQPLHDCGKTETQNEEEQELSKSDIQIESQDSVLHSGDAAIQSMDNAILPEDEHELDNKCIDERQAQTMQPDPSNPKDISQDVQVQEWNRRLVPSLARFFAGDLKHNAMVIVIDDIEKYDEISIELLCKVYEILPPSRMTIILTMTETSERPACLKNNQYLQNIELSPLSDTDLTILTKHLIRTMSQSREKLIIPQEICRQIAQRAYGSPRRAIDMVLKHFTPERIIQWNDTINRIRRQPLPKEIGMAIVERYKSCSETEKLLLQISSHLNAPFTAATLQSIISSINDKAKNINCMKGFKKLRLMGFFERAEESLENATPSFVFKHDCERFVIAASTPKSLKQLIYAPAAQWYALNNPGCIHDEVIGDLWRNHQDIDEACRFFEHAAYRAYNKAQYVKSWPLFRKLIECLPENNMGRKVVVSLDSARIAFRTGQIDEGFRLCRWSCYNALKLCAWPQAARANIEIASMLVELGSIRHVMRYIKRARSLLNRACEAHTELDLSIVLVQCALLQSNDTLACQHLENVRKQAKNLTLPHGMTLKIQWLSAILESRIGKPLKAIVQLEEIIQKSEKIGEIRLCALAHKSLGRVYFDTDNLSNALESWNCGLGLSQEMNDVVLHAALLADIADVAIEMDARRTARAALEQCLCVAQQTRQRALIARCLASNAYLQLADGQYEKSMRSLRKAHKSAYMLKLMPIWTHTLSLIALSYQQAESPYYKPSVSNHIYKRLMDIYKHYDMPMSIARLTPQYVQFLCQTHQNMAAINICRQAAKIYETLNLEKSYAKIQTIIDRLSREMSQNA